MNKTFTVGAVALLLSGCASIFQGATQPITISSMPESANVTVVNRAGQKIHTGVTPVTLTLHRGAGYFRPEIYRITMQKEGYASREIVISGTVNGWYFGNILFGGLIGMIAVDPATGAMYSLPPNVSGTLEPAPSGAAAPQAAGAPQPDAALTIVSTESLAAEVMQQARLLTVAE